jgi:NAD+ synthase (glutamine-hydrolysing)
MPFMRLVRIAVASVNTTVGAVRSNVDRAVVLARAAASDRATVVIFGEQLVGGYTPEDLAQWPAFIAAQWSELTRFAGETADLPCALSLGLTVARAGHLYNVAALVQRGRVLGLVPKEKLPTYNVFYEGRVYARGRPGLLDTVHGVPFGDLVFDLDFGTLGLEICEDGWSPDGPMRRRSYAGAEIVANLSGSPFRLGVVATRREMLATRAGDNQCVVAYANIVGGNDGLVMDGGGFVAQNGRVVLEAPRYVEGFAAVTVDLDRTARMRQENTTWRDDQQAFAATAARISHVCSTEPTAGREALTYPIPPNRSFFFPSAQPQRTGVGAPRTRGDGTEDTCEDLLDTLALGLGDYFEKTGAFRTIGVALSGGRDSLLCLYIARRWIQRRFAGLGPEAEKERARALLRAFFMPSRFTSEETRAAARQVAEDLDATYSEVSIDEAFERELAEVERMLVPGEQITAMARQNVQARVRAERMWTWANSAGGLFVQTSNMSEKAVGYTTIGGDMEGAFAVIANVPKTLVGYLLEYVFEKTAMRGIELTLRHPASAELAEDQEDERELMPFPVLDACLALFAGGKMSSEEVRAIVREMFPEHAAWQVDGWVERFVRLFTQSIYKWVQTPLAVHVGNLDLDRERALQLPVVQRREW